MSEDWAASALGWWQEAGVDTIVGETPRDWLKPAADQAPAAIEPAAPSPATPAPLPDDLPAFHRWLAESHDLPLATPAMRRFAPEGDPAADLMILIAMPGRDALIGGEEGALLDGMLRAIGRGRESVYLSPLSMVRTPTGRISAAELDRLAPLARHHVGLARPKALLLFGDACAQALTGAPVAQARGRWHAVETPAGPIRAVATIRPEDMARTPGLKKLAWEDLQMLMQELEA